MNFDIEEFIKSHSKCIVFVCGPFKSGSSLVTQYCEEKGLTNPAEITNPNEHGYGRIIKRYQTRECTVARHLNNELIRNYGVSNKVNIRGIVGYLKLLQYILGSKIIIKNPRFLWTIEFWCKAALREHFRVAVLITLRNEQELYDSWMSAPWTRNLLSEKPNLLCLMLNIAKTLPSKLAGYEIFVGTIKYNEIINLFKRENTFGENTFLANTSQNTLYE